LALLCSEHGDKILYGTEMYALDLHSEEFPVVCETDMSKVPLSERNDQLSEDETRINIYRGTSIPHGGGGYGDRYQSYFGFEKKEFLFSISREDIEKYLPETMKLIKRLEAK